MNKIRLKFIGTLLVVLLYSQCAFAMGIFEADSDSVEACKNMVKGGLRKLTDDRTERYLGKTRDTDSAF